MGSLNGFLGLAPGAARPWVGRGCPRRVRATSGFPFGVLEQLRVKLSNIGALGTLLFPRMNQALGFLGWPKLPPPLGTRNVSLAKAKARFPDTRTALDQFRPCGFRPLAISKAS